MTETQAAYGLKLIPMSTKGKREPRVFEFPKDKVDELIELDNACRNSASISYHDNQLLNQYRLWKFIESVFPEITGDISQWKIEYRPVTRPKLVETLEN